MTHPYPSNSTVSVRLVYQCCTSVGFVNCLMISICHYTSCRTSALSWMFSFPLCLHAWPPRVLLLCSEIVAVSCFHIGLFCWVIYLSSLYLFSTCRILSSSCTHFMYLLTCKRTCLVASRFPTCMNEAFNSFGETLDMTKLHPTGWAFCFLTEWRRVEFMLLILARLQYCQCFTCGHSNGCVVLSYCCFNLVFNDMLTVFLFAYYF